MEIKTGDKIAFEIYMGKPDSKEICYILMSPKFIQIITDCYLIINENDKLLEEKGKMGHWTNLRYELKKLIMNIPPDLIFKKYLK